MNISYMSVPSTTLSPNPWARILDALYRRAQCNAVQLSGKERHHASLQSGEQELARAGARLVGHVRGHDGAAGVGQLSIA